MTGEFPVASEGGVTAGAFVAGVCVGLDGVPVGDPSVDGDVLGVTSVGLVGLAAGGVDVIGALGVTIDGAGAFVTKGASVTGETDVSGSLCIAVVGAGGAGGGAAGGIGGATDTVGAATSVPDGLGILFKIGV